jgi:hypothetical protein
VKLPWLLPDGTTWIAPPPTPSLLLPLRLLVAAATGTPRAMGRDVVLLLLLFLCLQALNTNSCRAPSHHILPGVFQS